MEFIAEVVMHGVLRTNTGLSGKAGDAIAEWTVNFLSSTSYLNFRTKGTQSSVFYQSWRVF
jgi:hypothetical protein